MQGGRAKKRRRQRRKPLWAPASLRRAFYVFTGSELRVRSGPEEVGTPFFLLARGKGHVKKRKRKQGLQGPQIIQSLCGVFEFPSPRKKTKVAR
jgi:hypothetical protein